MTNEEIEKQIQTEYNQYLQKPFSDTLPGWFITKFWDALMSVPQDAMPHRAETLSSIMSKRLEELTIFEVGVMINIYIKATPQSISGNYVKFIGIKSALESIQTQWYGVTQKEERRLHVKAQTFAKENQKRIIPANGINGNKFKN